MRSLLLAALLLAAGAAFWGCNKDEDGAASIFYGTWVKGPAAGDTLRFFRKDGKNILSCNLSFTPALTAPSEIEYTYANGKLHLHYAAEPLAIESFEWKQHGKEFELLGFELFLFMSSSVTRFTYHKIE